jgi:hypothetical protein
MRRSSAILSHVVLAQILVLSSDNRQPLLLRICRRRTGRPTRSPFVRPVRTAAFPTSRSSL